MKDKDKILDCIAKLEEQIEINHSDIAELSRQTMRQHYALKNVLLDKRIMSQEEYSNHREKVNKELRKKK